MIGAFRVAEILRPDKLLESSVAELASQMGGGEVSGRQLPDPRRDLWVSNQHLQPCETI